MALDLCAGLCTPTHLQKKFRHYSDVWRLDLDSLTWDKLPAKGGPKARSGHRMVAHKNRLIMFGGFHDDGSAAPE